MRIESDLWNRFDFDFNKLVIVDYLCYMARDHAPNWQRLFAIFEVLIGEADCMQHCSAWCALHAV